MKELINDIIEYLRTDEANHFEENVLPRFSKQIQEWYWNIDMGDKERIKEFLLICEIHHFTNHIYYKLMKLKYENF